MEHDQHSGCLDDAGRLWPLNGFGHLYSQDCSWVPNAEAYFNACAYKDARTSVCARACMCMCVCVRVCVRVRMRVRLCVRVRGGYLRSMKDSDLDPQNELVLPP